MSLDDEIDVPASKEPPIPSEPAFWVGRIVYLQWLAVALSVVFGQCERWGYSDLLETGLVGAAFTPVVQMLLGMAWVCPVAMALVVRGQETRRITTRLAVPLSIAMSFTQILALIPLFQ